MDTLLEANAINAGYGQMQVLWDTDIHVNKAERVVLLGANGAGKTTLLKAVMGLVPLWKGTVVFDSAHLEKKRTDERFKRGISYMSESGVIAGLTVEENLRIGGYYLPRLVQTQQLEKMYEQFPDLQQKRKNAGGSLSGGQRKMLGVAKALMSQPRLLVMDEPSAGLSPLFVKEVIDFLVKSTEEANLSLLIAEQNVKFLEIADRVYVLDGGKITFSGTVLELVANDAVKRAYFGLEGT